MRYSYYTWHENEVLGLENWILSLPLEDNKVKKLRNVINKIKIRNLLIKTIESEDE